MADSQSDKDNRVGTIIKGIENEVGKMDLVARSLRGLESSAFASTQTAAQVLHKAADEIMQSARRLEQLCKDDGAG